jgi:transitional endoplasmic reticulum ATPase
LLPYADLIFLSKCAAIFAICPHQRDEANLLENLRVTNEDFEQAFAELIEQRN